MINSPDGAALSQTSDPADASRVVLVVHGGGTDSVIATSWLNLAVLRLWPFARSIARRDASAAVYRLRFAVRGWNRTGEAALRDAHWALATLRERHPGRPIVLVGHSMGGRVALLTGGDADVAGVVLLEPWAPSDEPADQLAGVPTVIIRGGHDRVIPPATTNPWIARARHTGARVDETLLPWAGHAMLRRFWVWHRLAADGVESILAATQAEDATGTRGPHERPVSPLLSEGS
ncbi:Alpha/beta hydrolase family protein [Nakamurella panacisegetis]|uniref:Alpha/beta hydrolase family protein n=1 Tax=Nakamurella panacisegetis TaxID=1090615 RepID=A0A1H0JQ08_9ACTN|nr:alpha/beta fold hydrolase [Nakamurella panacisegetis]SDO45599.1 Alpha/beta hydrolase family protein [Nakamurella panacisegetis]